MAGCSHPAWPTSTCTGSTGNGQTAAQACWSATQTICWCSATAARKPNGRLTALTAILAELGLELKQAKTRIVHLKEGGEGLDFLGFHHRWVRGNTPASRHLCFLARWPSRQAMQRARDRVGEITDRRRLLVPVDDVVQDVNRFLRGWSGYFRYGNSARQFDKIDHHAVDRIARFVAKRHKRGWGYGWKVVVYQSPNRLGLISLNGTIVAPRPTGRGVRDAECPPVKNVGEPCAGEPHARFDAGAGGNQASRLDRAARRLPPTLPRPFPRGLVQRLGALTGAHGCAGRAKERGST